MKFIFPQNYNFKNKLFGIIDYPNLFLNIIWDFFIFLLINLLFKNTTIKLFVFIIFALPVLLFSIFSINHENIFKIIIYLFNYITKPKMYVYSKNNFNSFIHKFIVNYNKK